MPVHLWFFCAQITGNKITVLCDSVDVAQIQQMEENENKRRKLRFEGQFRVTNLPKPGYPARIQEVTHSPTGIIRDWHASPTRAYHN